MIRLRTVLTLLGKELLRLKKNPGALMLLGLLVTIALLISLSWKDAPADGADRTCWIVYHESWAETPWANYLHENHPEKPSTRVVPLHEMTDANGDLKIPANDCAIEILPLDRHPRRQAKSEVVYHFPSGKQDSISPAAAWFWGAWKQFESTNIRHAITLAPYFHEANTNMASMIQTSAAKNVNLEMIATMLLLAVQFFTCCHLYVSFGSQDRERGTLSALALSPASIYEILLARLLFHLSLGMSVSALILLIINRSTSLHASSFLVLACVGTAWLCVGTVISALTKTQSTASMLMFCYMLGGGILFYLSSQFPIFRSIQLATFENHAVALLHASIKSGQLLFVPLVILLSLTGIWAVAATTIFRRFGWQS